MNTERLSEKNHKKLDKKWIEWERVEFKKKFSKNTKMLDKKDFAWYYSKRMTDEQEIDINQKTSHKVVVK
jgi:hypothetical protein